MDITIIYGFRNREIERVQNSLNSLSGQTDQHFKVIFVDYGSEESFRMRVQKLVEEYSFCTYVYNETRGMPWNRAHALNTGIKIAESQYVFTADVDLIFAPGFIARARSLIHPEVVFFFPVVYLTPSTSYHLAINHYGLKVSDENARGLALINRHQLEKIRGIDEFYCFWGHEDNDLELRLRLAGCESNLYTSERLLFHQWHATVKDTKLEIPKGWLNFQSDYFKYNRTNILRNMTTWGRMYSLDDRPAWKMMHNDHSVWEQIDCKPEFLRYRLFKWMDQSKQGDILALQWAHPTSEQYERSKVTIYARKLQRMLDYLNIPLKVRNSYSDLYPNSFNIRDVFSYFVVEHRKQINDFACQLLVNQVRLVIVH